MTKKQLMKQLENAIAEKKVELKIIKQLLELDLNKFDGKKITKRLDTALRNSDLRLYTNYDDRDKYSFKITINLQQNDWVEIYIRMSEDRTQSNIFSIESYKKTLNDYAETRNRELNQIKKDLDNIDTIIELTNKLHDQIEDFKNVLSYRTAEDIGIHGLNTYKFRKIRVD